MPSTTPDGCRSAARPVISVIGCGYLGATHATCMADLGFEVIGIDTDTAKIAALAAGEPDHFEPDLQSLLAAQIANRRLRFTTAFSEAAAADIHFLCVGTPQRPDGLGADVSALRAAVAALAPHLRRSAVVVGKSTVPVGTAATLATLLREGAPADAEICLAWNPEFLREGRAVEDTLRPGRLVFGVERGSVGERALRALRTVYQPVLAGGVPEVVTDLPTAELAKTAANGFLATKVSYVNAMAELCDASGADVVVLAEVLALDSRIGGAFLRPGLGFGGGCLPKDIRALTARADQLGAGPAVAFLREIDEVNLRQRRRIVDIVRDELGGDVRGTRITVLGAAFKPGTDDVRDSPALDVATALHTAGAAVTVHDPHALAAAERAQPALHYDDRILSASTGADLVLLATDWDEYKAVEPAELAQVVRACRVVDARHALDPVRWAAAGWSYRAPGRPGVGAEVDAPRNSARGSVTW